LTNVKYNISYIYSYLRKLSDPRLFQKIYFRFYSIKSLENLAPTLYITLYKTYKNPGMVKNEVVHEWWSREAYFFIRDRSENPEVWRTRNV